MSDEFSFTMHLFGAEKAFIRERMLEGETPADAVYRLIQEASQGRMRSPIHGGLQEALNAGRLQPGQRLVWIRKRVGKVHYAVVTDNGCLRTEDGVDHKSPSGACQYLTAVVHNGLNSWADESGKTLREILRGLSS